MTLTTIDPDAAAKLIANRARLRAGSWGGTETVCMMSAMVSGALGLGDCVTAGWPEWLVDLNVYLFDADVGADDEDAARFDFALSVAQAVQRPIDYDVARDRFLVRRLDTGEHSALKTLRSLEGDWPEQIAAVERVVALLHRRIAGEDVTEEMEKARNAAFAAADAAYAATRAAAYAIRSAAYAAASAAAEAVRSVAYVAADASADAATRSDLIAILNGETK